MERLSVRLLGLDLLSLLVLEHSNQGEKTKSGERADCKIQGQESPGIRWTIRWMWVMFARFTSSRFQIVGRGSLQQDTKQTPVPELPVQEASDVAVLQLNLATGLKNLMLPLFLVENGDWPLADLLCHHTRKLDTSRFGSAKLSVRRCWQTCDKYLEQPQVGETKFP
jgi:hypothetical protein